MYVPANNTAQWFPERGMSCNRATASDDGSCVARLVTPALRAASRAFFGCADIAGAELENYDTTPCQKLGSHWEARVGWADAMNRAF